MTRGSRGGVHRRRPGSQQPDRPPALADPCPSPLTGAATARRRDQAPRPYPKPHLLGWRRRSGLGVVDGTAQSRFNVVLRRMRPWLAPHLSPTLCVRRRRAGVPIGWGLLGWVRRVGFAPPGVARAWTTRSSRLVWKTWPRGLVDSRMVLGQHLAPATGCGFSVGGGPAQRGQVGFVGSAGGVGNYVVQVAVASAGRRQPGKRQCRSAGAYPAGQPRAPVSSRPPDEAAGPSGRCGLPGRTVPRPGWGSSGRVRPVPGRPGVISTCTGTGWPRSSPVSRATNMSARARVSARLPRSRPAGDQRVPAGLGLLGAQVRPQPRDTVCVRGRSTCGASAPPACCGVSTAPVQSPRPAGPARPATVRAGVPGGVGHRRLRPAAPGRPDRVPASPGRSPGPWAGPPGRPAKQPAVPEVRCTPRRPDPAAGRQPRWTRASARRDLSRCRIDQRTGRVVGSPAAQQAT